MLQSGHGMRDGQAEGRTADVQSETNIPPRNNFIVWHRGGYN